MGSSSCGRPPRLWGPLSSTVLGAALAIAIAMGAGPTRARADDPNVTPSSLKKLSLEELFEVKVTLVSKRPEKLSETASAIQVITSEDIRRSGAMNLAEALSLASNVEVQQINSYAWVVSTRGFDALFANKLLVMIDGRTVYTPLDAGVFWDAQNVLLEDIDRIEVISGPGGTLWGANAVNGVINIVTRSAEETQGAYLSGSRGSFLHDQGAARFGGRSGAHTFYRVYAQRFDRNGTTLPNGDEGRNAWNSTQAGFRLDSNPSPANSFTLQGDGYVATEFNTPSDESTIDGQNLLGHWAHTFSASSTFDVRAYADRTWRNDLPSTIRDQLETYDLDVQHRFPVRTRHDVLWGVGYRVMLDDGQTTTPFVGFVPPYRDMRLFSSFVQDEISLVPGRLKWTIGTKLEHTAFSGLEVQPGTRLAWTPSGRQTIWGAVSRAVRSPSRIDVDYHIPKTPPYAIAGGPRFDSERLIAYEFGYRIQPSPTLSLGLATFYNHYEDLYSVELESPPAPLPYTIQNGAAGQSWGAEVSCLVQLLERWRVRGGYTYFRKDLWSQPGHDVLNTVLASLGNDPRNQAVLQSMVDITERCQWDLVARYVDLLPSPIVPNYIALDTRLGIQIGHWDLAIVGKNLTDDRHPEFDTTLPEIPRSVYGTLSARWW